MEEQKQYPTRTDREWSSYWQNRCKKAEQKDRNIRIISINNNIIKMMAEELRYKYLTPQEKTEYFRREAEREMEDLVWLDANIDKLEERMLIKMLDRTQEAEQGIAGEESEDPDYIKTEKEFADKKIK